MVKKILFVCTGNSCRSPMARLLFENIVNSDRSLKSAGIEADSAGTAVAMHAATPDAIRVMREHDLDLSEHYPKSIDSRLVDWPDLVLAMTLSGKQHIISVFPQAAAKTYTLSEYVGEDNEVPDPYQCGIEVYRECAAFLQFLLSNLAEKLKK